MRGPYLGFHFGSPPGSVHRVSRQPLEHSEHIRLHLEYLIVIIGSLDKRLMNNWRWRFWGVDCACSGGCVIVEVNGVCSAAGCGWLWWSGGGHVCVWGCIMQPGPGAAVAGYLKKQELFSTTSHQSPVSDDWFARRDRQRPAAPPSIHSAATRDTRYYTLAMLQLHTGPAYRLLSNLLAVL